MANLEEWDEDLPPQTWEEAYRSLLNSLRLKKGFGLFFVECSPADGRKIAEQLKRDLLDQRVVFWEFEREIKTLYDAVAEMQAQKPADVLILQGLEPSFYEYEKKKKIEGWNSKEIYKYSWKGVPRILVHLNQQRDHFRNDLPIRFVFLVPTFVFGYLQQRAPDFFDWRSANIRFPDNLQEIKLAVQNATAGSVERYESLTSKERRNLILEIRRLFAERSLSKADATELLFEQGILFYLEKDYATALASYNQAIKFKSDYYQAWNARGLALSQLGRREEAIASHSKAFTLEPNYYKAWKNFQNALFDLESEEKAISSFKNLESKGDEIFSLEGEIESRANDRQVWYSRGLSLANLGRYEEAIASFDKAIELKPDFHDAWHNRGLSLANLGRYEEAIASFDKAIELKPDFHDAWHNRGLSLANLGRYEEAIASFDKAIEFKPDFHDAWHNRGLSLANLGHYEEAIASIDKAIEFKPDFHDAWHNRGLSLANLGRYEEAITSFDRALSLQPRFWQAWQNRGSAASRSISSLMPSILTVNSFALNRRGYEGEIASYIEGLKYVLREEQPEGWGVLHWKIGRAEYFARRQARWSGNPEMILRVQQQTSNPREEYDLALVTLTEQAFPEHRLRVLKDYIRLLFDTGATLQAESLLLEGSALLARLLHQEHRSDYSKKQLILEFPQFGSGTVDSHVLRNKAIAALETAENSKNGYLQWLLFGYHELPPFSFTSVRSLLSPDTAAVYWHLSPSALNTFLLLPDREPQIVASEETPAASQGEIGASLWHLLRFEAWAKAWNDDYVDYRTLENGKGAKGYGEDRRSYSWRTSAVDRLAELRQILQIDTICDRLPPNTKNLLLVPHRDLHLYPLEALFEEAWGDGGDHPPAISRLPSLQVGLMLLGNLNKKKKEEEGAIPSLLSIEVPANNYFLTPDDNLETYVVSSWFARATRIATKNATKDTVLTALQEPHTVFHFTGHANYVHADPTQSFLALAKRVGDAREDRLTFTEIYQSNLESYRLVFLSACETGLADNLNITNEYVGLVSAFVAAGVSNVLSTLWTTESKSSALLCDRFYQLLWQGTTPALALMESKQWLRSLTNGELCERYREILADLERLSMAGKLSSEDRGIASFLRDAIDALTELPQEDKPFDHPYFYATFTLTGL